MILRQAVTHEEAARACQDQFGKCAIIFIFKFFLNFFASVTFVIIIEFQRCSKIQTYSVTFGCKMTILVRNISCILKFKTGCTGKNHNLTLEIPVSLGESCNY